MDAVNVSTPDSSLEVEPSFIKESVGDRHWAPLEEPYIGELVPCLSSLKDRVGVVFVGGVVVTGGGGGPSCLREYRWTIPTPKQSPRTLTVVRNRSLWNGMRTDIHLHKN